MNDGPVAGGPEGRPMPPWHHPARPRMERRRLQTSPLSLRRRAEMARAPQGNQPRRLDQVREAIRMWHYSIRTEEASVSWITRDLLFHGKRHPLEMGEDEITQFLSALAVHGPVSASTQNQALCALILLYRHVLGQNFGWVADVVRATRPPRPRWRALDHGKPLIWCWPAPAGVPETPSARHRSRQPPELAPGRERP